MMFSKTAFYFCLVCLAAQTIVTGSTPVRVAVTPFHWERDSAEAAEKSAEYSMIFFTGALEVGGVQLIERSDESPLWEETSLIGNEVSVGWNNVDIVVRGRFEMQRSSGIEFFHSYRLKIEIIDVTNGDILESVTLEKNETGRDDPIPESLLKQAPHLLKKAIARRELLKNTPRFFPMFFSNQSPNDRLDNFELDFKSFLIESLEKRSTSFKSLTFGGSEDSLEEQTLNWLGFTDLDRSKDWQNIADYFLWGEYSEVPSEKAMAHADILVDATIHWLARDGTTGKVSDRFRVGDFKKGVIHLGSKIPERRVDRKASNNNESGEKVSDYLFERAVPLLHDDLQEILRNDPKVDRYLTSYFRRVENDYAKELVFTSCLFDPGDLKKQYILLHFGEGSNNPVLNARRIRQIDSWLAAALTMQKEKRIPRAASANLIPERFKLCRRCWRYPAKYEKRPAPIYQTPESIERFTRIMSDLTAILGEDNEQERIPTEVTVKGTRRSKRTGYADRYVSDILFNVIPSHWINPDQKVQILKLAWSLVPESQRENFLVWKENDVDKIVKEIGSEKWQEILETPSFVTHSVPGSSVTGTAKNDSKPGSVTRRRFVVAAEARTEDPSFKNRFAIPREIEQHFRREKFTFESIRKVTPTRVVATGKPESNDQFIEPEVLMAYDSSHRNPEFRETSISGVFRRDIEWSSDGKWGVTKIYGAESTARSVDQSHLDLFRLTKIAPDGSRIADLSPPDRNLIRNTPHRKLLVEDRLLVLIDNREEVIDINFSYLSKIDWRSKTISLPELKESSWYGERLHPYGVTSLVCNKWIFLCRENSALLLSIDDDKTYSMDDVYQNIIERNLKRIRDSLGKENLSDAEISKAVGEWDFSVEAVSVADGRIFLLHTGGMSSFNPSGFENGNFEIDHLDCRDLRVSLYDNGKVTWLSPQSYETSGELGNMWLWVAHDNPSYRLSTRKIFMIDRNHMKLIGTVAIPEVLRGREMLTLEDSIFLVFDGMVKAKDGKKVTSKMLTRFTREQLLEAAVRPISEN